MSAPFFTTLPGLPADGATPHGRADRGATTVRSAVEPEPEQRFSVEWEVPQAS